MARAGAVADRTEGDVSTELTQLRILLVILGVTVTIAHVVVFQFGRQLAARPAPVVAERD